MPDHKLILSEISHTILKKRRSHCKRKYEKSALREKGKNIKALIVFVKCDNLFYAIVEFYTEKGENENDL